MEQNKIIEYLMKNTYINFMMGAGTSYNKVDGKNSFPLMKDLLDYIKNNYKVKEFYDSLLVDEYIPDGIGKIIVEIYDDFLFGENANIEKFLSTLDGFELYVNNNNFRKLLRHQIDIIRKLIRDRIKKSNENTVIDNYINFYNGLKCLKEINAIKNQTFNIFTTNYDMMNEIAMEKLNIHYYSGFEGVVNRKFNIAYYNYDFVDNFQVNHSKINVVPDHINLFKLHGSLSWCLKNGELVEINPYKTKFLPEIIYPSVDKFKNTNLIIGYSSLMRELSNRICKDKTTLFVTGMSMGDEHINKIIENAMTINSFHLVIFCATEDEIKNLAKKYESYDNVIVKEEVFKFADIADFMNDLRGGYSNV